MNPLLSIITLLATLRADLYTKFNTAMKKAEPLEQFEAGSAARGILSEIDWAKERLERSGQELQATLENAGKFLSGFENKSGEAPEITASRFLSDFTEKVSKDAIAAALGEKKIVSIEDHNNALTAARESAATEAKKQAEGEFNAKLTAIKLVADRRADAVTRVGEIAAATLSDDILAGEKFEEAITSLEGRVSKLKEENITAESRKDMFSNLIAKASEEEFTASLGFILDAAGGKLAAIKTETPKVTGPKVSTTAAAPIAGSTEDRKKVVI